MRLSALASVLMFACVAPAAAVDVVFNGEVQDTCELSIQIPITGGIMLLGTDPTILGSDQGGTAVSLTILSRGANTVTVGAPQLTDSPVGYSTGGQSLQIGYVGVGLLSVVNKPMGPGGGSFSAGLLGLAGAELLMNARIVNPSGFALGDYQLTSVVTCS